uniref:XK-related protein n=1 Tax=Schistocephalus solidus TaxID=70667 RepID=A0A0X3NRE9_SCHSO
MLQVLSSNGLRYSFVPLCLWAQARKLTGSSTDTSSICRYKMQVYPTQQVNFAFCSWIRFRYAPPAHLGPIFSRLQTRRTTERKGRLVNFTVRVVPSLLIFTECFLESIPQFLIQSFNLLTSPVDDGLDVLTVISTVFSLITISWASSGLWFTVREHIYFPCPCRIFQLSSLVYYLSNLFMLSGRLLAVSAFAASVGLIPMLYVLLTLACVAVLTDVAVSWGHTERSKLSKENIVPRLVEVFGLLSDVPFSITFMMGPARIGCYCLWAFETLFLDVFAFAWLSSQQISAAANTNSTILETSASLRIGLLALDLVLAAAGLLLRYFHFRLELKDLQTLDKNICAFGEKLQQNEYLKEEIRLVEETNRKAEASMESTVPDEGLIVDSLRDTDRILRKLVKKTYAIYTELPRVEFARELNEELRQIKKELQDFTEQFVSTGITEDWPLKFIPITFKLTQLSMELEDLCFYFDLNSRLHKTSSLGVYQKILDAFAANIFVGNENLVWIFCKHDGSGGQGSSKVSTSLLQTRTEEFAAKNFV